MAKSGIYAFGVTYQTKVVYVYQDKIGHVEKGKISIWIRLSIFRVAVKYYELCNKDIWRDSKKYCIICENECIGDGIQIINNFICNKCIERMNLIDVGSDEYEIIKNKIKNSIADKIIKNK